MRSSEDAKAAEDQAPTAGPGFQRSVPESGARRQTHQARPPATNRNQGSARSSRECLRQSEGEAQDRNTDIISNSGGRRDCGSRSAFPPVRKSTAYAMPRMAQTQAVAESAICILVTLQRGGSRNRLQSPKAERVGRQNMTDARSGFRPCGLVTRFFVYTRMLEKFERACSRERRGVRGVTKGTACVLQTPGWHKMIFWLWSIGRGSA